MSLVPVYVECQMSILIAPKCYPILRQSLQCCVEATREVTVNSDVLLRIGKPAMPYLKNLYICSFHFEQD